MFGHAFYELVIYSSELRGKDRRIAPRWELLDESGHVALSGQNVPSNVTRDLLKTLNDPQMVETSAMLGEIAQGEENAKVGIVVFAQQRQLAAWQAQLACQPGQQRVVGLAFHGRRGQAHPQEGP